MLSFTLIIGCAPTLIQGLGEYGSAGALPCPRSVRPLQAGPSVNIEVLTGHPGGLVGCQIERGVAYVARMCVSDQVRARLDCGGCRSAARSSGAGSG